MAPVHVPHLLRLFVDRLAPGAALPLPAGNRVIYVRDGETTIGAAGQTAALPENRAWRGDGACSASGGPGGATLVRWELADADVPAGPNLCHEARILLDADEQYLLRCDRVDFPPGGIAYTHTHRGPGVRMLLCGSLQVQVGGRAQDIQPGQCWFEAGPDPVLALAAKDVATSFVRCLVLPAALRGQPSIRYLLEEDRNKPRTQRYQVFVDDIITIHAGR
jgi:quercetin dioxygenase-like cupin family protein